MGTDRSVPPSRKNRQFVRRAARKIKRTIPSGKKQSRIGPVLRREAAIPRDLLRSSVEWARQPMADGNWVEAIKRWEQVLDRFGPASSWSAYRGLIVSYTNRGKLDIAEAVASRARIVFPSSVDLAVAQAELPMFEERWAEAIVRWQGIIDEYGPEASWKPYEGLTRCYEVTGKITAAIETAEEGHRRFPDLPDAATTWAQMAMVVEDWQTAVSRWEHVLERFEPNVPWKAYLRLAITYGRLDDLASAAATLQRGNSHNPDKLELTAHSAELAMAERDWPAAIRHWNALLTARTAAEGQTPDGASFPRRGNQWDWYEEAWQTIVRDWATIEQELDFKPSAPLYRALGKTLANARLPQGGLSMLRVGREAHPGDKWVAFDYAVATLGLLTPAERSTGMRDLSDELKDHPTLAGFCSDATAAVAGATWVDQIRERGDVGSIAEIHARNLDTLATFAPESAEATDELGSVHIIRLRYGSSTELELKAGRYFSRDIIERRIRHISERDEWDEMTAPVNLGYKRARELSLAFGERFANPPLLMPEELADAVLFFLFHEVSLHEPMRRLAADIAAEADDSPVYIESPTDRYAYLDGYSFSHFDVLYLYFELRKRGVNAFLCRYYRGKPLDRSAITFVPGVRALAPRGEVSETDQVGHDQALIPAGIRSVRRVLDSVGPALVYTSGSVIKEFAYDRSLQQGFPIEPEASVHPPLADLPSFTFDLWTAASLVGLPMSAADGLGTHATVEISRVIGDDWLVWLDRALHAYLTAISANSYAEIATRGIQEAHISDHIFADSALFAGAVKRSGGRVVLWPHSANPVHVNERHVGSFDEVHAVTRAGFERWSERFPDAKVVHSPSVMLDPPTRNTRIDPALPLSVVVIGGRSIHRHTPILNRSLHEESHRAFFAGLERLQATLPISLYFKPRGHTGEEEMWLSAIVGSTANWDRVLEHPMRVDLPNMLFVSISMGTSAVIEGLSRGIPGIVVRDFPVRDYTTLDENAFPTGPVDEMLDVVASCTEPDSYMELLERELQYYATELET